MRLAVLLSGLVVASCHAGSEHIEADVSGSASGAPGDSTSGSRLTPLPHGIQGDDGSKMVTSVGWRDQQLMRECAFRDVGGGESRCIPTNAVAIAEVFVENTCRRAIRLAAAPINSCTNTGTTPGYALAEADAGSGCDTDGQLQVFTVGGRFSDTLYVVDATADGGCAESHGKYGYFNVGAPVPLSTFVKGQTF